MQCIARRMVYYSIEDEEQRPREGPFIVVTVKSLSLRDMGEGGVHIGATSVRTPGNATSFRESNCYYFTI